MIMKECVKEIYSSTTKQQDWIKTHNFEQYYDASTNTLTIPVEVEKIDQYDVPVLPEDYGYKGGTARMILASVLGLPTYPSRDFDLICMSKDHDYVRSQKLHKELNPEDFYSDHTVEHYRGDYFTTRDFSLNEIIVYKNKVICTPECVIANYYGLIVPTEHIARQNKPDDPETLKPHLFCKALRFLALYQSLGYDQAQLLLPEKFEVPVLDSFHMALHLDRAWVVNEKVTQRYIQQLIQYEAISPVLSDPQVLQEYLSWDTDYQFQSFE